MAIILDGKAMFLKVMGANPPSSVERTRCYNGGSLSFLSNYRCSAGSTQLVNNDSLFPKKTLLYSSTSPEDAYQHGGQVTVIWNNTAWEPTGGSPMSIVASTTRFYNDNGWPSLISASSGYYMETSGTTRTYYTISNGVVTNIGTYTPQVQEYWLELTETELTVGAGATSVDTLVWSYDKDSNSVEFTVEALDSGIQFIDYSYEWLSDGLAQVTLNFGSHSGAQTVGSLRITQIGGTETADVAITREAGSSEVCAADLRYMWMRDNSLDLSGLIAFKSQAHKGTHSSYDITTVTFSGYSTFRCYIRSYAESNYDYTIVSVLNATSEPLDADDATAYVSTKGNQQSGSALSNYTEVVFSGLTPSQTYFFYVVYRKDISQDSGNDEGYLLLPSSATYSKPYNPTPQTACEINMLKMWMRDSSLDVGGYHAFKSQANKGVDNTNDRSLVTFSGYTTFRCYIRSYAESTYDYAIISNLNAPTYPISSGDSNTKAHTSGNQRSGTALSDYTEVVFDGLSASQTYTFYIVYHKDISQDAGNDEGYILLPANTTEKDPYTPSSHDYVFTRYTSSPVSVGSAAGTVTIRVNSTKDGSNLYLNSGSISVPSGITVQSVSTSGNVTVTLAYPKNTGAARSFPITMTQPESGNVLEYSIAQEAGQVVPGTYFFESYADELEIGTGSTSVQMSLTSCKRPSGGSLTPVGFTVSSLTSGLQLVDYDYDWQSSSAALVTLSFNAGTQSGTIRFVQNESGNVIDIYIRRV